MCDKAYCEDREMIIIGDINLNFLKRHQIPSQWFEIMDTFNLHQLIKEPTRITKTTKSCIDHIYVSNVEHIRASNAPHLILEFQIIFQYAM